MCGVEGRGASDRALGCIVKTPRIWSLQEQLFAEDPSRASTWENSSTHRSLITASDLVGHIRVWKSVSAGVWATLGLSRT